ncbi:MAG: PaaI family thioesterase [Nitrososphaerota archaeon]|nr:PaaI family thioesterase [Nitrososphaerota archaeon]MDG6974909.1 PaaI family thioesterase [Nitrososphaerota archaeon]MDG7009340.1 PaaI family thioesterase [Nitrososphaerota archaeon]MDG7015812.1 PaaI family thioesterase [Nitrososphaerota archaeon]MDG7027890.1 PaaI family thioesterase [Nitrososphaerota archaeon]
MSSDPQSLQDRYAPNSVCFGCGPKNQKGLRVKSITVGDAVIADWTPGEEHVAFGAYGSGGIISVLLDCNGNWAAAYALMKAKGLDAPPGTVTAEYTVKFLRPSPIDRQWRLTAWATRMDGDRVNVSGELSVGGTVTATMTGLFVAVREGHPAFDRWR